MWPSIWLRTLRSFLGCAAIVASARVLPLSSLLFVGVLRMTPLEVQHALHSFTLHHHSLYSYLGSLPCSCLSRHLYRSSGRYLSFWQLADTKKSQGSGRERSSQTQGLRNPDLQTPTLDFCNFYPFLCFFLICWGHGLAVAKPWPQQIKNNHKKRLIIAKIQCRG